MATARIHLASSLLPLLLLLLFLSSSAYAQNYTLSPTLAAYVTGVLALEAALPPLNTSGTNPNPARHTYPLSNPTLALGTADPQLRSVTTTSGVLHGQAVVGTRVSVFAGVPYAQPPVGALRWRPPVAYVSNATFNATSLGAWCGR